MAPTTPSGQPAGSGSASGPQSDGGAPKTLVVDFEFDHKNADPGQTLAASGSPILHAMYDSLLTFAGSDASKLVPSIAKSYQLSADARTLTFELRDDVTFSDGTPLTAEDVLFTFNRVINLKGPPSFLLNGITVAAPDAHTVTLQSVDPNPSLPYLVTSPFLGILNSRVLKDHGGSDAVGADQKDSATPFLATESAGSGPYVLDTFSTTDQVVLKTNPKYWGTAPAFGTVVFRNILAPVQALNVQRGEYEVAFDIDPTQAATLNGVSSVKVDTMPSAATFWIFCNADPSVSDVTSNPAFVEAVRYGIDYDGLVALAGANVQRAAGMVPPMFLGALPASEATRQDVDRAKAALARANLVNPTLELKYPANNTSHGIAYQLLAEKVKSDLAAVGITVNLAGAPIATFIDQYRSGKVPMVLNTWGADYPDPSDYLVFLPGHAVGLRAGWAEGVDLDIERLGQEASQASDSEDRASKYQAIQRLLNERSPWIPLIYPTQVIAYTKSVGNVTYNPSWLLDVAAMSPSQ